MKLCMYFSLLAILILSSCNGISIPDSTATPIPIPSTTPAPTFTSEPSNTPDPKEALSYYGLIAYTSNADGNDDIFTMHADGSNQTNITNNPARDILPAWSPDGKKIAFVSTRINDKPHVFSMNPDGSGVTQLTDGIGHGFFFKWSPDGKKIAYVTYSDDPDIYTAELIVIDADGRNKTILTKKLEYDYESFIFGWSPDSQYLVYRLVEGEKTPGLYITKADGSNQIEWTNLSYIDHTYWLDNRDFIAYSQFWWEKGKHQSLIQKLGTDGSRNEFPVFDANIVTVFDNSYVTQDYDGLKWFTLTSPPMILNSCNNNCLGDDYIGIDFYISPNKKLAFVITLYQSTSNNSSSFFLMNEDGSVIQQVGASRYNDVQLLKVGWSPDSKYVTIIITGHTLTPDGHETLTETGDIYLFDIQKTLEDPSTQPIRLTTDEAAKNWGPIWQPTP